MVDSSDEEDEDILHVETLTMTLVKVSSDLEMTSELLQPKDGDEGDDEDEDTQEELREKRNELMEFIESMSENDYKLSVKWNELFTQYYAV